MNSFNHIKIQTANSAYIILKVENPYCVVNSQGRLCESILIYPLKRKRELKSKLNACIIYSITIDKFLLYTTTAQATIGFNNLITCINEYLEADTEDELCSWIIQNKQNLIHKCSKYKI